MIDQKQLLEEIKRSGVIYPQTSFVAEVFTSNLVISNLCMYPKRQRHSI